MGVGWGVGRFRSHISRPERLDIGQAGGHADQIGWEVGGGE